MLLRNRKSEESNAYICNVSMKREKERDGKFLRRIFVLSSSVSSSIADTFTTFTFFTSSIFSNMPFNVFIIYCFFFKRDFYITHIYTHSYTHIHTQCTDVRAKERKDVSFRDFFLFRIIKKKKNIDPSIVEKKKYLLQRNVSLNRRRDEILNLLIVIFQREGLRSFLIGGATDERPALRHQRAIRGG